MSKRKIIIYLALFLFISVFARTSYCETFLKEESNTIPGPVLLSPTTKDIVLSGRDYLEFTWERTSFTRTNYFDFRVYKGFSATDNRQVFKQKCTWSDYPPRLPASLFEENQVYSWMLIQVFTDGKKSDKSFSSFKIIKK